MKPTAKLLRGIAVCALVTVAFADLALAQSPPPPPPPPPQRTSPPSRGYPPQSGYPAAQPAEGAGIRREQRVRFAVGTQLGAAVNEDWEKWLGGQVSMYYPMGLTWHLHVDLFYGFMERSTTRSYRIGDSYYDNYHDVESDMFGSRLMLGYWVNDVLAVRFGGIAGFAGGYTYTGYCGERDSDGKVFGPSVALGFHGWHPAGSGAWEFGLQLDKMFGMPYSQCYRSFDDSYDVWNSSGYDPMVIQAQGLYFF